MLMPTWLHFRVKIRPRRPWAPQPGAQDGPGATQEAPKMRQEPPKSYPSAFQEAIHSFLHFSYVGFLVGLWWVFGGSLVGVWWVLPKIQHMKNEENIDFLCRITSMHRKTITKSNKKVLQNATKNRRS